MKREGGREPVGWGQGGRGGGGGEALLQLHDQLIFPFIFCTLLQMYVLLICLGEERRAFCKTEEII